MSVPSLLDPSMAPPGKHVIHAYVPATEPYEWWSGLDRGSPVILFSISQRMYNMSC